MEHSFDYLLPDKKLKQNAAESTKCPQIDQELFIVRNSKKVRIVYDDCIFDESEEEHIQEFKQYCLKHHFDANNVPDKTIVRYLYSYDFDHKEALSKLKVFLQWHSDPQIQRHDSTTLSLINQGCIYTYGRDKKLRPIIYLNVAIMDMEKYSLTDYLAAINQVVTVVVQKLFIKGKLQNYLFVIDTGNKSMGSLHLSTVKEMVLKLSHVYSMRMGKLLVINCNTMMKIMYSAVSPFLAEITKQKIKLLSHSQVEKGKMRDYVDQNQLEEKYGGNLDNLDQKWPPRIPGRQLQKFQKKKYDQMNRLGSMNEQEMFQRYGENSETMKACCSVKQCQIY